MRGILTMTHRAAPLLLCAVLLPQPWGGAGRMALAAPRALGARFSAHHTPDAPINVRHVIHDDLLEVVAGGEPAVERVPQAVKFFRVFFEGCQRGTDGLRASPVLEGVSPGDG